MKSAIFGFGTLGRDLMSMLLERADLPLFAVIDNDPDLVGQQASRIAELPKSSDLRILSDLPPAPSGGCFLFHGTTSHPETATAEILSALSQGYTVITAAEWMFHPGLRYADHAAALDLAAREKSVHVLGCGINPGFIFESLPVLLARTTGRVDRIEITRVSDVSGVGPSDVSHLGLGLTADQFQAGVVEGSIVGHDGFPESVAALAEYLGLHIDTISDRMETTLATTPVELPFRTVQPGEVAGITQIAQGIRDGKSVITMNLSMFLRPSEHGLKPHEAVKVAGSRDFSLVIAPGASPAAGAAAMMSSAARLIASARPEFGLLSLLDLPVGAAPQTENRLRVRSSTRDSYGTTLLME